MNLRDPIATLYPASYFHSSKLLSGGFDFLPIFSKKLNSEISNALSVPVLVNLIRFSKGTAMAFHACDFEYRYNNTAPNL